MSGETSRHEVLRISGGRRERIRDVLVNERPVTIVFNDVELATLMCSPKDLDCLAVGFLFSEGLVRTRKEVRGVFADEKDGVVWVETKTSRKPPENLAARRYITTGCGRGLTYVDASGSANGLKIRSVLKIPVGSVRILMKEFQRRSRLYKLTGGVHSAAIGNRREILVFNEDIGRHSAIDKVIGECVLKGIRTTDKILVTSGRITSEILVKAARSRAPIVISKSAPTDLAVKLAEDSGVTLVGFVRGTRMNIYSNAWRIVTGTRTSETGSRARRAITSAQDEDSRLNGLA